MIPEALLQELRTQPNFDEAAFVAAHAHAPVTSVRLNPKKQISQFNHAVAVPWCTGGYYLNERPSFTFDPLFHAGTYYVQEASSMFLSFVLEHILEKNVGQIILDLCAAPGGKSTLIAAQLKENDLLIANETIGSRANILRENLARWGNENVLVTNNDPKHFARMEHYMDVLVVDAPCSGSGLFRKEPNYLHEWNVGMEQLCSQRQQRILADVWDTLKPGGYLIYSTCSFSEIENEAIVDWIIDELGAEKMELTIPEEWHIVQTQSKKNKAQGFRFYPHLLNGEGFFCCVLRKEEQKNFLNKTHRITKHTKNPHSALLNNWLKAPEQYSYIEKNNMLVARPIELSAAFDFISSRLNVIKSGVAIGQLTHKDLIPEHELALSHLLKDELYAVEFTYEQAIQYLKKEEIKNLTTEKIGWAIAKYAGHRLGLMKILPNRINNYYPLNWRILKA